MEKDLNIGLIGFGLGGRVFHAPIIASVEGLSLYKIFERKEENVKIIREKYSEAIVVSDLKEIFEDAAVDIVVVATANSAHYTIAKQALEANKHVVVEKPFTITSLEAEELIELATAKKRIITVHQNRRWDSDFKTVRRVIESGTLGDILEYEAHFDRFRNVIKDSWKETAAPGTGILYDLGSHLIDQAQCIFGMPTSITGDLRVQREQSKIVDYFEIILNYEKTKVILKAGMFVKELGPHFIVHGNKGSFIKSGMDVQEMALKEGFSPYELENWGIEPETLWGTINSSFMGLNIRGKVESEVGDYRGFYENLRKSVLGEEELSVKPWEARNTIRLIELAMKSSEEKRTINIE